MNRRNFLACVAVTPTLSTNLMAQDNNIYLSPDEFMVVASLNRRLKRLRAFVGFGNFNLISYNQALYYGRNYSEIGAFTQKELGMMDRLFDENPNDYGFYGERTCMNIDNTIPKKDVTKIPYTGHYLFKGKSEEDYKKIVSDVGDTIILTSGVRNVIKQLSLYVNKIYNCRGNMTQATISIAPPAYSYHTVSDFDVGRKGWGYKNFTADFAMTNEFEKMTKLDYIGMRYTMNNRDGVRFEPWHVEII
ncbi:MAG: M15 family metallopeptidase [Campylobacterota bacterium]|nr:M15 family metallopeptidase [Campylobacterota bacterium]